jgi:hypothetical protein
VNVKNESPMIEKMLNVKKAIDYGASKKTLRKAT